MTPSTDNPLTLDVDGKLPMTFTAAAGAIEDGITSAWKHHWHRQSLGDLSGRWLGGLCSPERRLEALIQVADVALGRLHVGLSVSLDVDAEGLPLAILVSNPRSTMEIAVSMTPRALRISGNVTPLEIDSAGRRIVEVLASALAAVVTSPPAPDRRTGRRS